MASFFILDHSLDKVGSHHYDTVRLLAREARCQGFEVIIGANREIGRFDSKSLDAEVRPVFRKKVYSPYSQLGALQEMMRVKNLPTEDESKTAIARMHRWLAVRRLRVQQIRHVREFAQDCQKIFHEQAMDTEDHALLMTANELDFTGLAQYLAANPNTVQVHWHIAFHFGIYPGRPSSHGKQKSRIDQIRDVMQFALAPIPYHQFSFYTSTEELADQYNQLGIAHFRMMPYPVDQTLAQGRALSATPDQINFTVAGGLRREKGKKELGNVINDLNELRKTGAKIKLRLQRPAPKIFKRKSIRFDIPPHDQNQLIDFIDHPIAEDDYRRLIETTHVGLLFYDSRAYYARRAGVMGEYLTRGCPVVVPAGCWLSNQLAEPTYRYIESLTESMKTGKATELAGLHHSLRNVPMAGGVLSFDHDQHPFELGGQVILPSAALAVQFEWHWPKQPGTYADLRFQAFDSDQTLLSDQRQIVGHRPAGGSVYALFQLPAAAVNYKLTFRNAYEDSTASVKQVRVTPVGKPGTSLPTSAVGVTFADISQVKSAITEVISHFAHYANTARHFAKSWARYHDPKYCISFLVNDINRQRQAA
ncbi:MAG TPA: hypothetical protein PKD64_03260 [Pirellulaceae bacterium]|nr:hypothetical protein [Pirellulaceae bacterium]HMO91189.1 hypothetical protein [Pirellulaceae bacterium]HMP69041.1 hypothetical protein [Pirellulaceae bacterium]